MVSCCSVQQQVWGVSYIDELVQEGVNSNPAGQSTCDRLYCQDANYNVNLLVDSTGVKVERYAYTPYGVRTAYKASDAGDAQLTLAIGSSQAVMVGSVAQPYGLCEFGHHGLQHDEESGLVYNRARMLQPTLGRFMQRDPLGYVDGGSLYEYVGGQPQSNLDPSGLAWSAARFAARYWYGRGGAIDLKEIGNFDEWHATVSDLLYSGVQREVASTLTPGECGATKTVSGRGGVTVTAPMGRGRSTYPESWMYVMGSSTISYTYTGTYDTVCGDCCDGAVKPTSLAVTCKLTLALRDWFESPLDVHGKPISYSSRLAAGEKKACSERCYSEFHSAGGGRGRAPMLWKCYAKCNEQYPNSEIIGGVPYQINADWSRIMDFNVALGGCK